MIEHLWALLPLPFLPCQNPTWCWRPNSNTFPSIVSNSPFFLFCVPLNLSCKHHVLRKQGGKQTCVAKNQTTENSKKRRSQREKSGKSIRRPVQYCELRHWTWRDVAALKETSQPWAVNAHVWGGRACQRLLEVLSLGDTVSESRKENRKRRQFEGEMKSLIFDYVASWLRRLRICLQETQVWSLSWEDPLEKGMALRSSILAWETPWTEGPGELQSMGWQRNTTEPVTWGAYRISSIHRQRDTGRSKNKGTNLREERAGVFSTFSALERKLELGITACKWRKRGFHRGLENSRQKDMGSQRGRDQSEKLLKLEGGEGQQCEGLGGSRGAQAERTLRCGRWRSWRGLCKSRVLVNLNEEKLDCSGAVCSVMSYSWRPSEL